MTQRLSILTNIGTAEIIKRAMGLAGLAPPRPFLIFFLGRRFKKKNYNKIVAI
jgi:hypothetical protein